jgi:hypothetical protein
MSPTRLWAAIRGAFMAVFVPIHFAVTSGHLRSAMSGKSLDYAGRPVPWYTFPATDFLSVVDFGDADVLEFGGGYSTLWWAERARTVVSIESEPGWAERIREWLARNDNVEVVLQQDEEAYVNYPRGRRFDVVVIDGEARARCAETALDVVTDDGIIIVDDAEGYWGRPGTFPILDLLQGAGFSRVDFVGYAPGVRRPHSTSIFFREGARAFKNVRPPKRPYVV